MIATPGRRYRLLQKFEGGDMGPTKERNLTVGGTDETSQLGR